MLDPTGAIVVDAIIADLVVAWYARRIVTATRTATIEQALAIEPTEGRFDLHRLREQVAPAELTFSVEALVRAIADTPALSELVLGGLQHQLDSVLQALEAGRIGDGLRILELFDPGDDGLGPDGMAALCAHPWVASVEVLRLVGFGKRAGYERLLATPWPRLRRLSLEQCDLRPEIIEQLAGSPLMSRLEPAGLRNTGLGSEGARIVARCACAADMAELDLSSNQIGDEGLANLSEGLAALRELTIQFCDVTPDGLLAVLQTSSWPRLERVDHEGPLGTRSAEIKSVARARGVYLSLLNDTDNALFFAVEDARETDMAAALAGGADPNFEVQGFSMLWHAVATGSVPCATQLLDAGANVGWVTESGNSAAWLAAKKGNVRMLRLLIDRGASVDQRVAKVASERVLPMLAELGVAIPREPAVWLCTVGERVLHSKFGAGEVLAVAQSKIQVRFDQDGETRTLLQRFLRPADADAGA